jgi:predicted transcriptional regulator
VKYKVLITTIKVYGSPAVHTVVIEFAAEDIARKAIESVNNQKNLNYGQTAVALF